MTLIYMPPAAGTAMSPVAEYDATSGNVSLAFDASSIWSDRTMWGAQSLWGASVLNANRVIWDFSYYVGRIRHRWAETIRRRSPPSCELGGARQPNVHASAETLKTLPQERSREPFSAKQGSDVGQGEKGRLRK